MLTLRQMVTLYARRMQIELQTADGLPIHHEVFAGNTAETPTLLPPLETVVGKFPSVKRVVLVTDRGLLTLDNLDALSAVQLKSRAPLEFVMACWRTALRRVCHAAR